MERGGIAMNQCYPKYKHWARGTKSYPCRLYAKSGRERKKEIGKEGRESVLLLVEQKLKIESRGERQRKFIRRVGNFMRNWINLSS